MLADINVEIDQGQIREQINRKIDENINQTFLTIDINKMADLTCMSKSFLEQQILSDSRMKLLERKKEKGKRYWFYKESMETIGTILDEW